MTSKAFLFPLSLPGACLGIVFKYGKYGSAGILPAFSVSGQGARAHFTNSTMRISEMRRFQPHV